MLGNTEGSDLNYYNFDMYILICTLNKWEPRQFVHSLLVLQIPNFLWRHKLKFCAFEYCMIFSFTLYFITCVRVENTFCSFKRFFSIFLSKKFVFAFVGNFATFEQVIESFRCEQSLIKNVIISGTVGN